MTRFLCNPPSFMSREQFLTRFGSIYERSPWVARSLFKSGLEPGHDEVDGLAGAMAGVVETAGSERQLELLRAHPDLAGKLALTGDLTTASTSEQASAGLDCCTPDELDIFQNLNDQYNSKFGFPFILAVRGRSRTEILEVFRKRMDNDLIDEQREALDQVHRIAHLRLMEIAEKDKH